MYEKVDLAIFYKFLTLSSLGLIRRDFQKKAFSVHQDLEKQAIGWLCDAPPQERRVTIIFQFEIK